MTAPRNDDLTKADVEQRLTYNPETGVFTHRAGKLAGDVAGKVYGGYRSICVRGRSYRAHRLAWLVVNGEWPEGWLDHINRQRDDNRIANLRIATPSQNRGNARMMTKNKSGYRGVFQTSHASTWTAMLGLNKGYKYLGSFKTKEAASAAYEAAAREHYGADYVGPLSYAAEQTDRSGHER